MLSLDKKNFKITFLTKSNYCSIIKEIWDKFLICAFVDNLFLDRCWQCHQMGERSFFVRGRQFHICARCTGILVGYVFSPVLWITIKEGCVPFFLVVFFLLFLDGFTQLLAWRKSVNVLRFLTGLGFGLGLPPFCAVLLGRALKVFF